jgi:hypothetical protein
MTPAACGNEREPTAAIRAPSASLLPFIESDARRIELDPSNPNRIWWSGDTSSHLGYIELLDQ